MDPYERSVLSFDFVPEVIAVYSTKDDRSGADTYGHVGTLPGTTTLVCSWMIPTVTLSTVYAQRVGLGYANSVNSASDFYGKISTDRKTIYWYNVGNASNQFNMSGVIYYWFVFGQ